MLSNSVSIIGTMCSELECNHTLPNGKVYSGFVSTRRFSGVEDILLIQVSERLVNKKKVMSGQRVEIQGSFRSYNFRSTDGKRGTKLYIFVDLIRPTDIEEDSNNIMIEGCICRTPYFHLTSDGKNISGTTVAVPRGSVKTTDYLPLIAWSQNAGYVASLDFGDPIKAYGRIQSRTYRKKISEDYYEERTTYEISAYWIDYPEGSNNEANGA